MNQRPISTLAGGGLILSEIEVSALSPRNKLEGKVHGLVRLFDECVERCIVVARVVVESLITHSKAANCLYEWELHSILDCIDLGSHFDVSAISSFSTESATFGHSASQTRCWEAVFRRARQGGVTPSLARCPNNGWSVCIALACGQFIVANLLEALEGKGRPSTIAQQPLQAIAVGAYHSDRSVRGRAPPWFRRHPSCLPSPTGSAV